MTLFEKAVVFAVNAHSGAVRKDGKTPYILHPLEVSAIAGSMTQDQEVLAAAVLHDTIEDTPATIEEIRDLFGERIAALVAAETEDKRADMPPAESWQIRKAESLEDLKNADDPGVKIVWISDKLSNMRSFLRLYEKEGNALWRRFHQSDPIKQSWYYRTVARYTEELSDTGAWREYDRILNKIFEGVDHND